MEENQRRGRELKIRGSQEVSSHLNLALISRNLNISSPPGFENLQGGLPPAILDYLPWGSEKVLDNYYQPRRLEEDLEKVTEAIQTSMLLNDDEPIRIKRMGEKERGQDQLGLLEMGQQLSLARPSVTVHHDSPNLLINLLN
ncbi:unnamed protein product [Linum trigynum]|uniref:Uncharacterized protein n=1 Tax=Linum trigynum TaxID=586398 RepID=A0AAV2G7B1_9ROSI